MTAGTAAICFPVSLYFPAQIVSLFAETGSFIRLRRGYGGNISYARFGRDTGIRYLEPAFHAAHAG